MILPTAGKASVAASVVLVSAGAAALAEIPKPEGFWFQTWAGWGTLLGLVLTAAAVLALAKKVLGPTSGAQLRRGLEEPDTRRVLRAIWNEDTREEERHRDTIKAQLRRDVDAAMNRLDVVESNVVQMGKSITELTAMTHTLERIEHHMETFARMMDERGRQVDRIEGRLETWDGQDRRRFPGTGRAT